MHTCVYLIYIGVILMLLVMLTLAVNVTIIPQFRNFLTENISLIKKFKVNIFVDA